MPCRDDTPVYSYTRELCAVLRVLDERGDLLGVLASVNESESGIKSSDILSWWKQHKKYDDERREAHRAEDERRAKRAKVIRDLSPEQRRALGV